MLKIGDFSKLARTTIKTLRYYDDIGLFKPVFVDDNGYRYYEVDQLNTLLKIVELRELDMPIEDVKKILVDKNIEDALSNHLNYLKSDLAKKMIQISKLNKLIENVKKGEFMDKYEAKIIEVKEHFVYYRHGVIDSMSDMVNFILQAGAECKKYNKDIKCDDDYCYVTYAANEYKEKDVELEYVESVDRLGCESENIKFRVDPKIKAISVMHKGPYMGLQAAYAFALNYVKANNLEIIAPIREVYIDGCWNKNSEDDYLTEIQIPIK